MMTSSPRRSLRVLAADDSAVMRGVLRTIFQLHGSDATGALPPMELCGVVGDGVECMDSVARLKPDVILLDLEMPRLNGLGVLARLRVEAPGIPVIMCSAHTERGARSTLDALAHGAKDYVMKPSSQRDFASALDTLMEGLLPKIAALAGTSSQRLPARLQEMKPEPRSTVVSPLYGPVQASAPSARAEVVVIGVSTGGPSALESLLPRLPSHFAAPILIVQHMPKLFTGALAARLNRLCALQVEEATDGAPLKPGKVWLAPGDAHMEVSPHTLNAGNPGPSWMVTLHKREPLNSCKPSVDYLFRSAARCFGNSTLAVMMTGMGSDGLDGTRDIKASGGSVIAQDQASSAVWGMPGRVVEAGLADAVLSLNSLPDALISRTSGAAGTLLRN